MGPEAGSAERRTLHDCRGAISAVEGSECGETEEKGVQGGDVGNRRREVRAQLGW